MSSLELVLMLIAAVFMGILLIFGMFLLNRAIERWAISPSDRETMAQARAHLEYVDEFLKSLPKKEDQITGEKKMSKEREELLQQAADLETRDPDLFKFISEAYFNEGVYHNLTMLEYRSKSIMMILKSDTDYAETNIRPFEDVFNMGKSRKKEPCELFKPLNFSCTALTQDDSDGQN